MTRKQQRKILAEMLSEYELQLDFSVFTWTKTEIEMQSRALKTFARKIDIITYEECYDLSTQELIEKIDSEEES